MRWFTGSKVVHMGDLLFNGMFPYVDIDSGGSVAGLTRAAEQVLEWVDGEVTIVPGHGELADRAALERFHAMLVDCQALVTEALAVGDDANAMMANGLLDEYASWSWQFIDTARFLDMLVREAKGR